MGYVLASFGVLIMINYVLCLMADIGDLIDEHRKESDKFKVG